MNNLLSTLSEKLQSKLADFNVSSVSIDYGEVLVLSMYTLDNSYIVAIENELIAQGHSIER